MGLWRFGRSRELVLGSFKQCGEKKVLISHIDGGAINMRGGQITFQNTHDECVGDENLYQKKNSASPSSLIFGNDPPSKFHAFTASRHKIRTRRTLWRRSPTIIYPYIYIYLILFIVDVIQVGETVIMML